jgi:hypothetical protein
MLEEEEMRDISSPGNARVLQNLLENAEANGMVGEQRHPAAGKE